MAQITHGLRSLLSAPKAYDFLQTMLGAERGRKLLARDHLKARRGDQVLDIGCGTGEILPHLPEGISYLGFDLSQRYIDSARLHHGAAGRFECCDIADFNPDEGAGGVDLVLAIGILHHLDDSQAEKLIRAAWTRLRPGGRFVSLDGTFVDRQPWLARALICRDRGQNIRSPDGYEKLAKSAFATTQNTVRHDLLFVPYTHCVLECTR